VKVAAYQAPLPACHSIPHIVDLIHEQVRSCESAGVDILCCPEAVLGGLADYADNPRDIAIDVYSGQLARLLEPLASDAVATIVGFTEIDAGGSFYNSAAVYHRGSIAGVYRKHHPASRPSKTHPIYGRGDAAPVFTIGSLTFGIVICRDSTFAEPARAMAGQGATALFIPTNNGLPPQTCGPGIIEEARACDVARAVENRAWVIRADVAGHADGRVAHGSSAITNPNGRIVAPARALEPDLVVSWI
jgi:predicted amidohydrolase